MINILLIDNYDSFTYNLAQLLETSGLCRYRIVKNDEISEKEALSFDKLLLSPGPGTPRDAGNLMPILRTVYIERPILGICLGMQAIASCFGGELYRLPAVCHGQQLDIEITDHEEYMFKNRKNLTVGLYHSWAVRSLPDCLKVTACSETGVVMGLRHKTYDVRGVQFHPESYMTPSGQEIINNWLAH